MIASAVIILIAITVGFALGWELRRWDQRHLLAMLQARQNHLQMEVRDLEHELAKWKGHHADQVAKKRRLSMRYKHLHDILRAIFRAVAQSGSASALGAEESRFKSLPPDHDLEKPDGV